MPQSGALRVTAHAASFSFVRGRAPWIAHSACGVLQCSSACWGAKGRSEVDASRSRWKTQKRGHLVCLASVGSLSGRACAGCSDVPSEVCGHRVCCRIVHLVSCGGGRQEGHRLRILQDLLTGPSFEASLDAIVRRSFWFSQRPQARRQEVKPNRTHSRRYG